MKGTRKVQAQTKPVTNKPAAIKARPQTKGKGK